VGYHWRVRDWLLFLGAGASRPPPASLPPFVPLARGVLSAVGWEEYSTDQGGKGWRFRGKPCYPDIANFDMAPEVLFGTLTRFGVRFAAEVCRVLRDAQPNAVHAVAARVLQAGGCAGLLQSRLKPQQAVLASDRGAEDLRYGLVIACFGLTVKVALRVARSPGMERPSTADDVVEVQVAAAGDRP
jgi:hypothetical protein